MESPPDSTAKAAQEAFQKFSTEAWTLLAVGLSVILLRTYSRLRSVGFKGLRSDDFLVWLAGVLYAGETGLAYSVGFHARGLANNGMTDAQRAALAPGSEEYRLRSDNTGTKVRTIGGGGQTQSWRGRGPPTANPIPTVTFSESEERIIGHVQLQDVGELSNVESSGSANKMLIRKSMDPTMVHEPRLKDDRGFAFSNGGPFEADRERA
ncbi:hypothetical protein O9K51_05932 [Purpureocillium lavendulum]|uniref:Uncharacterized protein n=1 Tax=Purpureocillium lavendulum TaxID=1247861 RepID=A0AB34FTG6_9HYPO|nr:hypothetical protein O9K51_05932 [Purpureocillium lavendulum]